MAMALDVAAYIIRSRGKLDAMKLQKLVYYCQAWSLVWLNQPLFSSRVEAWRDGPVVPDLFRVHRGRFFVDSIPGGAAERVGSVERDIIDSVLGFYGDRSAEWLSERTHAEAPWRDARRGLLPFQAGRREITPEAMKRYYSSVQD
jgi:uncharacterized phage-associated protein